MNALVQRLHGIAIVKPGYKCCFVARRFGAVMGHHLSQAPPCSRVLCVVVERKALVLRVLAERAQRIRKLRVVPKRQQFRIRMQGLSAFLKIDRDPRPVRMMN